VVHIHKLKILIQDIYRTRDKNPMIISIDAKNSWTKIQQPFMIKCLGKLGLEGTHCNTIRHIKQTYSQHCTEWGKLEVFPIKSGMRAGCPCAPFSLNKMLE
jgi:hypothetical protein